jgi:hypothetical protein
LEGYITERELARRLGIRPETLSDIRTHSGNVPEHRRCECGRTIFYRESDAEEFAKTRKTKLKLRRSS